MNHEIPVTCGRKTDHCTWKHTKLFTKQQA